MRNESILLKTFRGVSISLWRGGVKELKRMEFIE